MGQKNAKQNYLFGYFPWWLDRQSLLLSTLKTRCQLVEVLQLHHHLQSENQSLLLHPKVHAAFSHTLRVLQREVAAVGPPRKIVQNVSQTLYLFAP